MSKVNEFTIWMTLIVVFGLCALGGIIVGGVAIVTHEGPESNCAPYQVAMYNEITQEHSDCVDLVDLFVRTQLD